MLKKIKIIFVATIPLFLFTSCDYKEKMEKLEAELDAVKIELNEAKADLKKSRNE